MFYNMVFGRYVSALLLTSFQVADCLHYYKTPALDNQFSNFEITTAIPSDGTNGTGVVQDALNLEIASWPYARRYFTFNFKGRGNAQLWILNSDKTKQFKVEIGGGTNHNQIYVFVNEANCFSTTVNNITSEKEYRSFWINGKWFKNGDIYKVRVGLGSDPREDELLKTEGIHGSEMNMTRIRLSTSSENSGEWQFASAGQTLGGCKDSIPCIDDDVLCCTESPACEDSQHAYIRLIGTCIPPSGVFPGLVFGDGNYPTACGFGEEVCGSEDDCMNNTCKANTLKNTAKEVCGSEEECRENKCQAIPATTTVEMTTTSMTTKTISTTLVSNPETPAGSVTAILTPTVETTLPLNKTTSISTTASTTTSTTASTTTTITQKSMSAPITSTKTLTTTKSTTTKQLHTTTTVPTTHIQTTILTVPLSSTQHVTKLYMCVSSMQSGCLVVTSDKAFPSTGSSSFFYTNRWAILGGTVGGLVFIGAATWVLLSHAAKFKQYLLCSRRVSPA